ncbi:MAG: hypothetical protein QNJ41_05210 [Xenococcaceae cyanobacterium MO_188.B32]|nr:hypothetical protein [Xenococcaceae cyanobacterium MO_188.B32]
MKTIFFYLLVICFSCSLFGCGEVSLGDRLEISPRSISQVEIETTKTDRLSEVSPPLVIQQLGESLEKYQPEVSILNPKNEKIYTKNTIEVRLKVKDLPLFKNEKLGLGPHLHLILDNEPDRAIYNTEQPFVLENLTPGTHTLRVFAAKPWDESFKNNGAYAQTTFHILTKTDENNPDSTLPLLTYSRPHGTYSAEPIMLDFYLTNAPSHLEAKKNPDDEIKDWHIKVTINGESFVVDDWKPIYLEGFKRGNNWVQLELIDREDNLIKNAFNKTIRLITYNPEKKDTLAKLVTEELSLAEVRGIVDSNYQPETISVPEKIEKPIVEPKKLEIEEIEPKIEPEVKPKSSESEEKVSNVKPKVNYTPPSVIEELNPVTEEVVETREPTLEVVPIPEKVKEAEKTEETSEVSNKISDVDHEKQVEQ